MSLPHRHAFHRPTQFNSLDPHGRSIGTARFDPTSGNKIDGEYNERGEPIGSPERHNLPFSKNTMSREEDWRSMFPRPSIPTGPALASSAPPPAPAPLPRPVITPAIAAGAGAAAASMNPLLGRIASSAARAGFPGPSLAATPAPAAPTASPARNVFQDRRDALKLAVEAGVGRNSGGKVISSDSPTVSGATDPAIMAARDSEQAISTPYGKVAVSLPLSQRGAFAGPAEPEGPPSSLATQGPPSSLAPYGPDKSLAGGSAPTKPEGFAAGEGVRSAISNTAGSVFNLARRAASVPGNFALGLTGVDPAKAEGAVANVGRMAANGVRALFPTPAPTYASTGSGPSPVPGSGNPDDLPATPDVSAFPRPQKRTTPLMDKPAQQY